MISKIKSLLEVEDDSFDAKIRIYLDYVENYIKSYCNILEIPKELETIACFMVVKNMGTGDGFKKVSMGDVSIEVLDNDCEYKNILNKFRKVGF